jgi:poly-gamma-glutamate synthase PgsB/CapB
MEPRLGGRKGPQSEPNGFVGDATLNDLIVVGVCLGTVVVLLTIEKAVLSFALRRIPTRVAVIGSRGKSSVVRLVATGLRAGKHRVVYKTTGSRPIIGYPDGTEHVIRRRGVPTLLEQRRLLCRAWRHRADVLVAEAMSIRPESLRVELANILAPQIVVITNLRRDHLSDLPAPIRAFAAAVPRGATVTCANDVPAQLVRRLKSRGIAVSLVRPVAEAGDWVSLPYEEWGINLSVALEICEQLGVPRECALEAMRFVRPDVGALSAWRVDSPSATWYLVNGFAANDPESTQLVLERALERWNPHDGCRVGLLNLREDRGDRTEQWIDALCREAWPFDRLVVVGAVPWSVRRRLRRAVDERLLIVRETAPDRIMAGIASFHPSGGFLFGFGNMGGAGLRLVEFWSHEGDPA